jgi:hypothetical protein
MDTSLPTVQARFQQIEDMQSADEYNFEHFNTKILVVDGQRTVRAHGIQPGEMAPDFTLPEVGGRHIRLSEFRGQPVLLHFGSPS